MADLEKAIGQYVIYNDVLRKMEPDRGLFLAIPEITFEDLFEEPIGTLLRENQRVRLLVFEPKTEVIRRWTP